MDIADDADELRCSSATSSTATTATKNDHCQNSNSGMAVAVAVAPVAVQHCHCPMPTRPHQEYEHGRPKGGGDVTYGSDGTGRVRDKKKGPRFILWLLLLSCSSAVSVWHMCLSSDLPFRLAHTSCPT
ncbi:hypothetical protein ACJQWK_07532 [Exserohilum turcicum]|uniref:Uncharacterized protein n=1 Tax=Exserohilum turcicum (strain 28A) TaxID=671987 RepID=R0JY80_EXST2|nr:uncharacterized protein SETTUDRAFT_36055 [Exserohilum turcica Et28A]EOA81182.1 hypothetical protein SETTUDRAFT_36055 [Exserohilum turcica Et28A]